jgi:translation elongation factor EF-G
MGRAEATVCCPNPSQPDSNITLNIFDVPNYTGSSIESIPTLRLTDGVLLRVDVVIGLRQETEDLTRFATREQTQIVLLLDNLAGALVEHHLDLDVISQRMFDIVEAINSIISVHSQGVTSTLNPAKGNVIFGSVAQGWAASIRHFSKLWAAKWTGIPEDSLCRSLWGQSYFDHEKKDFTKSSQNARGAALPLSFSKFVLEPISKILRSAPTTSSQVQEVFSMAQKVGVSVPFEWTHYSSDDLIREIISNWLPVAVTIVSTIVDHVPSPQRAQMV